MKNQLLKIGCFIISLFCILPAFALPVDGVVTSGNATINQTTSQSLLIQQGTDQAIINWQQFNIAQGEHVMIQQPGASSVLLNRVTGADPSSIFGQLTANGRIFLSNPNGVYFSPSARVDVGSLLATTFQISDTNFMSGNFQFARTQMPSAVINEGQIKVMDNGFVVLVGSGVLNAGQILAHLGTVWLASGERASIDFSGDGLMKYQVDGNLLSSVKSLNGEPLSSAVSNTGLIQANGGQVILSARTSADVFSSVINQSGIIEAKSLVSRGGIIRLEGGAPVANLGLIGKDHHLGSVQNARGIVIHSGRIDVSAQGDGANGGEVTLTGEKVLVSGVIDATGAESEVLVASSDFTVMTGRVDVSGSGNSNGGTAVLWSDRDTIFTGSLLARGGLNGKGGNAEISGYGRLSFNGQADLTGPAGDGTLLLDPRSIRIVANNTGFDDNQILDGIINSTDGLTTDAWTISANSIPTTGNIVFEATDSITVGADFFHTGGGSIRFGNTALLGLTVNIQAVVDNTPGKVEVFAPGGIHFSGGGKIRSQELLLDSSPSGSITTTNGNFQDIFTVDLTMNAGLGIGSGTNPFHINVSTLSIRQ
jgi:filamentous hemagglutinin family protein